MKPSDVEDFKKNMEKNFNEYKDIVNTNQEELLEIIDWLNGADGYFNLYLENGEISIDTSKGEDYKTNTDEIDKIKNLMEKNNFSELTQDESFEDVDFIRILNNDAFVMHYLTYHKGELNPESQGDWEKIADNFYYSCSVGE